MAKIPGRWCRNISQISKGIAMRASPNSSKGLYRLRAARSRPLVREPTRMLTRFRVLLAISIVFAMGAREDRRGDGREDGREDEEGKLQRREETLFLEQGDESIFPGLYTPVSVGMIEVVTYLRSLARRGAFSGPSLKVDDVW
jgi:hypothetical protein